MKVCFVTVGATAGFDELLRNVLSDTFITALKNCGFTHLMVQYGAHGQQIFTEFLEAHPEGCEKLQNLGVGGFDFKPSLDPYFAMAVKNPRKSQELGLVVSHGGSGTVLGAMQFGLPLILVPNEHLANNHQEELVKTLSKMGYAHKATPDCTGEKRPGTNAWQGRNSSNVMADQLSFLD
ncbi:hypothetical protein N7512_000530 [Penicillium capsulatum]|nr:hypothetical protein N7512_000530 [Penicillium capsulatum]